MAPSRPRPRRAEATFWGSVRWPDARRGPYRVRCGWSIVEGYAQLVSIEVAGFMGDHGPDPDEGVVPVTASTLRLPIEQLAQDVLAQIREQQAAFYAGDDLDDVLPPSGRRGRQPLTTDDLTRAAALYRQGGTKPTTYVAQVLGISPSAAAKRIAKARAAGLLEKTTQGRVGGPHQTRKGKR